MLLLFSNGAQTPRPSLSIVTGNPIGLLLVLTYMNAGLYILTATPDCRTYFIDAENRTLLIESEDRTHFIDAENRTMEVRCH